MRYLQALIGAVAISYGLFWMMQQMIAMDVQDKPIASDNVLIDFVRLKKDSETQTKQRKQKIPPKPQKPKITQQRVVQNIQTNTPVMKMPSVTPAFDLAGGAALAGFVSGNGLDGNAIPMVQVMPQYPANAKRRKIEGSVKLHFTINEDGTVSEVSIVESNPKGIFDRAAVRAAHRWKFKPRVIDGKPIRQKSTQIMQFSLDKSL